MTNVKLIPLVMDNQDSDVKALVGDFPVLDASGAKFDKCVHDVCVAICEWLQNDTYDQNIFGPQMVKI